MNSLSVAESYKILNLPIGSSLEAVESSYNLLEQVIQKSEDNAENNVKMSRLQMAFTTLDNHFKYQGANASSVKTSAGRKTYTRKIDVFSAIMGGYYTFQEGTSKEVIEIPPQKLCTEPWMDFDVPGLGPVHVDFEISLPEKAWFTEERKQWLEKTLGPSPPKPDETPSEILELQDITTEDQKLRLNALIEKRKKEQEAAADAGAGADSGDTYNHL